MKNVNLYIPNKYYRRIISNRLYNNIIGLVLKIYIITNSNPIYNNYRLLLA